MTVVIDSVKDAAFIKAIGRGLRGLLDHRTNVWFAGAEVLRALLEMPPAERERLARRLMDQRDGGIRSVGED
jgi:hypothetical protein